VPHLRTTLFEHLVGTSTLLAEWGCGDTVALAGLCHAAYGTDGFTPSLLPLGHRHVLADAVGPEAEQLVYLHASCDRRRTYPQLARPGPVDFHDRFTGTASRQGDEELRAFVDLSLANELEILLGGGALLGDPPDWLVAHYRWVLRRGTDQAAAGARAACPALRTQRCDGDGGAPSTSNMSSSGKHHHQSSPGS
jgi:hypothetical protein